MVNLQDLDLTRREVAPVTVAVLAFSVGCVAGGGAVVFRGLIALIHNVFFNGELSLHYDAYRLEGLGVFGPLIILAPVIGGMGVVFLVRHFAPEARGHGVPEIMDAVYYKEGQIRPVVAFVKSIASALAIGSGASVGREGPIAQIGASFGSTVGLFSKLVPWQTITLVAAGAGAGIAATFNTPLGGVLFAVELLMPEISTRTFLPVVIATGTATYIGRMAFGLSPAFDVPASGVLTENTVGFETLVAAVVLGLLCGLASFAFVRLLAWMEDFFPRLPGNEYAQHAVGMLILGMMIYVMAATTGYYHVEGVGYGTIQALLKGELSSASLLAILFAAKLLATTVTLGAGSSGGIFSPSLFMGATLGSAFALLAEPLFPGALSLHAPDFAMVGMAAIVAGATGASMTAIVMIFEMTRDYYIILPLIIAVGFSVGVRQLLSRDTIYTIKLVRRNRHIPMEHQTNMYLVRHAGELMDSQVTVLPEHTPLVEVRARLSSEHATAPLVVSRAGRIVGIAPLPAIARPPEGLAEPVKLGDVVTKDYVVASENDILSDVLARLGKRRGIVAVVVRGARRIPRADNVIGLIGRQEVGECILQTYR
jgi:CIC family chloride channel protein